MRRIIVATLLAGIALVPGIAQAQDDIPGRVDRLEHEMRAVQRKVFPDGAGRGQQYVEPQITAPEANPGPTPGVPASSPIADLNARVSALESQQATLTGEVETTAHRIQQLEDSFAAYRKATDVRLSALESGQPGAGAGMSPGVGGPVSDTLPADGPPPRANPPRPGPKAPPLVVASGKDARDPARAQALAAIERPSTGDPAEDTYLYGYRLWGAKMYPEAEEQLRQVVAKYPNSKRASYAQNLLGRAYLDEGKPSLASLALYDSYKKMPEGDRAPDSLYYLAQALIQLNKPADACKVYSELSDVYGAKLSAARKSDILKGRAAAKCN
jgi:TolA-binding protein